MPSGRATAHVIDLQPQRAAAGKRHALQQIPLPPQLLQKADDLPGIAARFSLGALQAVQLLQHGQRQNDVVVLKGLQGIGGLHQHIGVQGMRFSARSFRLSDGSPPRF